MIHELRIYHVAPGRLPDLHVRFQGATLPLFERHGIRQVGFWTVLIGAGAFDLYYLLEWYDMGEREHRWSAFTSDPDWKAACASSERDGPLIAGIDSVLLAPTLYSKIR